MEKLSRAKSSAALAFLLALSLTFLGVPLLAPEPAEAAQSKLTAQDASALTAQSTKTATAAKTVSKLGLTSGHTYVVYSALGTKKSLDVKNASGANNANVQIWGFGRSNNQQWVIEFDEKGYAAFRSLSSGKYLAVKNAKKKDGANVVQQNKSNSLSQKWKLTKNKNGTFTIKSVLAPKFALDVSGASSADGTNVQIWTSNKTAAQQWKLYDVNKMHKNIAAKAKKQKGVVKAGTYVFLSKASTYEVLDISGASKDNYANLQTYYFNTTKAQRFTISYDKTGYALIKNSSGKYLDVSGAGVTDGTNVQQYEGNGTLAQKWIITKNSDGSYRIQSALWADLSLDVSGGVADDGTNVQVYTNNNTNAQKWRILTPSAAKKAIPVALGQPTRSSFNGISVKGAKAAGIDVSVWQGNIDWNSVAATGIRFAIIRCGYGSNIESQDDACFLANVRGARAAGIDIGIYLYSHATNTSMAKSEADHTLRMINAAGLTPKQVKYGVYLDIEAPEQSSLSNKTLKAICNKYCSTLEAKGFSTGVYASLSWWNSKLTDPSFNNRARWIAQWPYKTGGRRCEYGGNYKLWQCMSDGSVPGIVGRVDMNLAY